MFSTGESVSEKYLKGSSNFAHQHLFPVKSRCQTIDVSFECFLVNMWYALYLLYHTYINETLGSLEFCLHFNQVAQETQSTSIDTSRN